MDVWYYLDADSGLPHIYGHGVTEGEVEHVLRGSGGDLPANRGARMKIGQTVAGRYLQVIYTPDGEGGVFVITAHEMNDMAKKAFLRRRRSKGK